MVKINIREYFLQCSLYQIKAYFSQFIHKNYFGSLGLKSVFSLVHIEMAIKREIFRKGVVFS